MVNLMNYQSSFSKQEENMFNLEFLRSMCWKEREGERELHHGASKTKGFSYWNVKQKPKMKPDEI